MHSTEFTFNWIEYAILLIMLTLSLLIGVYYTFFNKQKTFNDYMLGGKSMGVFPVSMSIVASFISGITLLGAPAEVYLYGTQCMASNISNLVIVTITGVFYLPVFYKLQLSSIFEYLEMRFNRNVRFLGTLMYSLSIMLILPAVLYVPAITLHQGLSVHVITTVISAVCLFYTAFGGLKAVLWTDALQNGFTLFSVVFVIILGYNRVGGIKKIWNINEEGHRLEFFNLDPSPFTRNTFWNISLGYIFLFLTNIATNPGSIQRYLSVPTLRDARMVLFYSSIGFFIITNLCYFMGMVLYAKYHQCDPVAAGYIKSSGQIVLLYVMEIGKEYPGLAGLFMSGVLSAALSTVSAWLNTVGGTLFKDIMEVFFSRIKHSEAKQSTIIKGIVITLGVTCIALVAVVEKIGTFFQMTLSLMGIVYGSILSLFTLGLFFPRVNSKAAIIGTVVSLVLTGWISINAQYYIIHGKLQFPGKVTSIDQCPSSVFNNINASSIVLSTYRGIGSPVIADSSVPLIYQLSYNYYSVLGTLTGIIVGLIVSFITTSSDLSTMNPDLFSTYVYSFLPKKPCKTVPSREEYKLCDCPEY